MDLTVEAPQSVHATAPWSDILPVAPQKADHELAVWLREVHASTWPAGLYRHASFSRRRDGEGKRYRAVAWNPATRELFVLELSDAVSLNGPGRWHRWSLEKEPGALDDVEFTTFESPIRKKSESANANVSRNKALVRAMLRVTHDIATWTDREPINDAVLMSKEALQQSVRRICLALGKNRSYQKKLKLLLHRYFYFGGEGEAYLDLTDLRGGRGKTRVGKNRRKPGRKNVTERESRNRAAIEPERVAQHQAPVRGIDLRKMLLALERWWVAEKRDIAFTYQHMCVELYSKVSKFLTPTVYSFRYHAKKLIAENDLRRKRNGQRLHDMYDAARIGRATDPTGGAIEILDVDGFQAKVFIKHPKGRRKTPFQIWVIFAVSRLSSAVVGYSLSLTRENARAYKECLASVHIPKSGEDSKAAALGLGKLRGLLHGNYDEIYVDHGPGASESVLSAIVDRLRLARSIPPPRRPELRAIGESLNNLILRFYQNADAGYSRARDPLSQEKRRAAKKAAPVSVEQFERLLLLSINHINLYYAKRRKLTDELRRKGINSTPERLFTAYQAAREGDRKRKLSPVEVWEKYSDWEWYSCRRGNVKRDDLTYSSEELREYYDHKIRWEGGGSIPIQVQRTRDPHLMYWRKEDGSVSLLQVNKEDARRLADRMSWFEWELFLEADGASEAKLARQADDNNVAIHKALQEASEDDVAPQKRKAAAGEVMVSQQRTLDTAQNNRLFMAHLLESTRPAPTKKPAPPAKTEHCTGPSGVAPDGPEPHEPTSGSDWAADFDADMEESLADLM
ncbi:hypothetical protein [Ralstonia pseudosolanacearum]|uniref:hypothetical protein n=1 Tax=Ralstonia pseudosolanacearum TaxID=1310165 RepID=UPI001FFB5240|nr:hypothetical protein [Ralstonia pseudosolanacearum]